MPQKIKTAVIGIGRWGKNVARDLAAVSELAAYASHRDTAEHRAWAAADAPGTRRASLAEICADTSITAVAVATPATTHVPIARALLDAGKHVLVEKPIALDAAAAQALATTAAAKNRVLMSGYQFLYDPAYAVLRERLRGTSIRSGRFAWTKFGTFDEAIEWNLLTHHLAIALDLLGKPARGAVRCLAMGKTGCDALETRLDYDGVELVSHIDRTARDARHALTLELGDGATLSWETGRLIEGADVVFESEKRPLAIEVAAFAAAAAGTVPPPVTAGDFGARVVALHEMLTK